MKKSQFYLLMIILVVICAFPTFGGLGIVAAQGHFYWIPFVLNIGVYGYLIYFLNKMRKEAEVIEGEEAEDKIKEIHESLVVNPPKIKTFKKK